MSFPRNNFAFETLEPRLLLSANAAAALSLPATHLPAHHIALEAAPLIPTPAPWAPAQMDLLPGPSADLLTAPDSAGAHSSEAHAALAETAQAFSGLSGDILTIELAAANAAAKFTRTLQLSKADGTAVTTVQAADNSDLILQSGNETLGRIVFSDRIDNVPFETAGRFYFAPEVAPHADPQRQFLGSIQGTVKLSDGTAQAFRIDIADGYSTSGPAAVQKEETALNLLREQQRLRYLGYGDLDYEVLAQSSQSIPFASPITAEELKSIDPTGALDEGTRWALGMFANAATQSHPVKARDRTGEINFTASRLFFLQIFAGSGAVSAIYSDQGANHDGILTLKPGDQTKKTESELVVRPNTSEAESTFEEKGYQDISVLSLVKNARLLERVLRLNRDGQLVARTTPASASLKAQLALRPGFDPALLVDLASAFDSRATFFAHDIFQTRTPNDSAVLAKAANGQTQLLTGNLLFSGAALADAPQDSIPLALSSLASNYHLLEQFLDTPAIRSNLQLQGGLKVGDLADLAPDIEGASSEADPVASFFGDGVFKSDSDDHLLATLKTDSDSYLLVNLTEQRFQILSKAKAASGLPKGFAFTTVDLLLKDGHALLRKLLGQKLRGAIAFEKSYDNPGLLLKVAAALEQPDPLAAFLDKGIFFTSPAGLVEVRPAKNGTAATMALWQVTSFSTRPFSADDTKDDPLRESAEVAGFFDLHTSDIENLDLLEKLLTGKSPPLLLSAPFSADLLKAAVDSFIVAAANGTTDRELLPQPQFASIFERINRAFFGVDSLSFEEIDLINSPLAPRWKKVNLGKYQPDTSHLADPSKSSPQDPESGPRGHSFATSWVESILQQASQTFNPSTPGASNIIVDLSPEPGGFHPPHAGHQNGDTIDVDVLNLRDSATGPFFFQTDGKRVLAKNPQGQQGILMLGTAFSIRSSDPANRMAIRPQAHEQTYVDASQQDQTLEALLADPRLLQQALASSPLLLAKPYLDLGYTPLKLLPVLDALKDVDPVASFFSSGLFQTDEHGFVIGLKQNEPGLLVRTDQPGPVVDYDVQPADFIASGYVPIRADELAQNRDWLEPVLRDQKAGKYDLLTPLVYTPDLLPLDYSADLLLDLIGKLENAQAGQATQRIQSFFAGVFQTQPVTIQKGKKQVTQNLVLADFSGAPGILIRGPVFQIRNKDQRPPAGFNDLSADSFANDEQKIGGEALDYLGKAFREGRLVDSPLYQRDVIAQQLLSFLRIDDSSQPHVSAIFFNDPHFYLHAEDSNPAIRDQPLFSKVHHEPKHNGHFHVDVAGPQLDATPPQKLLRSAAASSTTFAPVAQARDALKTGLAELSEKLANLQTLEVFAQQLPFLNTPLSTLFDLRDDVDLTLVQPVIAYLDSTNSPTIEGVVNVLRGEPGIGLPSGEVLGRNSDLVFHVSLQPTATIRLPFDFNEAAQQLGLTVTSSGDIELTTELDFDLTFGVDLASLSPAASDFFIQIDGLRFSVRAAADDLALGLNVGLLAANIENGSVQLDAAMDATVSDPNDDGRLTLDELDAITDLLSFKTSGRLTAELPVASSLGAFDFTAHAAPRILIQDDDIFSAPPPQLAFQDFDELLDFKNLRPDQILALLKQFSGFLDQFRATPLFQNPIPFTGGKTLGDLLDLKDAFLGEITPLVERPDGSPAFSNVQDLVKNFVSRLGGNPDLVGYDPQTKELTFRIELDHAFAPISLPLQIDLAAGHLADIQTSSLGNLQLDARFDFTFGLDLSPPTALPFSSPDPDGLANRFSVRDLSLTAQADFNLPEIAAAARFGFFGIKVVHGQGLAEAQLGLKLKDPGTTADDGQIDLPELINGLKDPATLIDAPRFSGAAKLNLPFELDPPIDGLFEPNQKPALILDWSDITDPSTLKIEFNQDMSRLLDFENVNFSEIVAALRSLVGVLRTLQGFSFLDQKLPLVNLSISELLDQADWLAQRIDQFEQHPQQTLQTVEEALEDALGLPDPPGNPNFNNPELTLTLRNKALLIDFNLVNGFNQRLPFNFDLASIAPLVGADVAAKFKAISNLVDVSGAGTLDVRANANLAIHAGIDFANPLRPRPFLLDSSRVDFDATIAATNLVFQTAAGPLGIFIGSSTNPGAALLRSKTDRDGNPATIEPANFSITWQSAPEGRYDLLNGFSLDNVHLNLDGAVSVDLPVFFPNNQSRLTPDLTVSIPDLVAFFSGAPGQVQMTTPDFSALADSLSLSDQLGLIADALDYLFQTLQRGLEQAVLNRNLPLVGNHLSSAVKFIQNFRDTVIPKVRQATSAPAMQQALFDAFGPAGLNVLTDGPDANTTVDPGDVVMASSADRIQFNLHLAQQLALVQTSIPFDIGLPALGLSVDGNIVVRLGWDFFLGFGLSKSQGFYLDAAARDASGNSIPELTLNFAAGLPDLHAIGQLGFLQLDVKDEDADATPNQANDGTDLDGDGRLPSSFKGQISINLQDPANSAEAQVPFSELAAGGFALSDFLKASLTAAADVNLDLTVSFGQDANFPSIHSDFHLGWNFANSNLANTAQPLGNTPEIEFNNVQLDLGSLLSKFAKPIVDQIQTVLKPIKPLLDILTTPLPVLSDLAPTRAFLDHDGDGKVTLIEMAALLGDGAETAVRFVNAAKNIADISDLLSGLSTSGKSVFIDFGSFNFGSADVRSLSNLSSVTPNITGQAPPASDQVDSKAPSDQRTIFSSFDKIPGGGFQFPFLKKPSVLFALFLGQPVVLATYDMPRLDFTFTYSQFFPIIGPLGVTLMGTVEAVAHFAFGFDTVGLQKFQETKRPEEILNGLFVSDKSKPDGTGSDVPEVTLSASIDAFGSLDAAVASAGVGGGISADVFFNLHDPDSDGKVRAAEILSNLNRGPLCLFDVTGDLKAGLKAFVRLGSPPFDITKRFNLAEVKLLDFNIGCGPGGNQPPNPVLAQLDPSLGNGVLRLNMGPFAAQRRELDTEDGDETFTVSFDAKSSNTTADDLVIVEAFGARNEFPAASVKKIYAEGGAGNDTVTVKAGLNVPVEVWGDFKDPNRAGESGDDHLFASDVASVLHGGGGNDQLSGRAGNDQLSGDAGDDLLLGAAGNDQLDGGAGDDVLEAGDGNDLLHGGDGSDQLYGGPGDDRLDGGAGNDQLSGDEGNDQLTGGTGNDVIEGGDGNDIAHGSEGDDAIKGDAADDQLFGDIGADQIEGGDGIDQLFGGDGNDLLNGGANNDQLHGDAGRDVLLGGAGDDQLDGGTESDQLNGEVGNDRLDGGPGDDLLIGGLGSDQIIGGIGSDTIFAGIDQSGGGNANDLNVIYGDLQDLTSGDADIIFGDAGRDQVFAGGGDDSIAGLAGDDSLFGGPGNDQIAGGAGDDVLAGDNGDDELSGEAGRDLIWGGRADIDATAFFQGGFAADGITPIAVNGNSIPGQFGDGKDQLDGGADDDWLFGGSENDLLNGASGNDYIDGGAGRDTVNGGSGDDVLHGGLGDDLLHGNAGIDHLFGDEDSDQLYADAGDANGNQTGQQLFGGPGEDYLYAYASSFELARETAQIGDELNGGPGNDRIFGNIRKEILNGGPGNDFIHGDYLRGPLYEQNQRASIDGADDQLFGESGDDQLFGGGGNDVLWGGADSDWLEGQDGADILRGGSGIDLLVLDAQPEYRISGDQFDGHFGDSPSALTADDNATDILLIEGTSSDDHIRLSQDAAQQLTVEITTGNSATRTLNANWRSNDGKPLVEQFRISGLAGNDLIDFAQGANALDVSGLAARSNDFVTVIDGGPGDDVITGTAGRDRVNGGKGSDTIYGLGGDDRLWGDTGDGVLTDLDTLYGGQGNDDLIGGQGRNLLSAWSHDPAPGDFGVFVDPNGNLRDSKENGLPLEDTGLNRVLGGPHDDQLYGGTGLDFLYGNGGQDKLFNRDGTPFDSKDQNLAGEDWKAYARSTDRVWYVSGSNANDIISVNYVTEPGLLQRHHLVTRSVNNNGVVTFAAQFQLDFSARSSNGKLLWDPADAVVDLDQFRSADLGSSRLKIDSTQLNGGLLPPESDVLAIIIDALDGDDEITVGPTVQTSVWADAGAGDDKVVIQPGTVALPDKTEQHDRNDTTDHAFTLSAEPIAATTLFKGLTIDNPDDVDWYRFQLASGIAPAAQLLLSSVSEKDGMLMTLFEPATNSVLGALVPAAITRDQLDSDGRSNNSLETAYELSAIANIGKISGLTLHNSADVDLFKFTLNETGGTNDSITLRKLDSSQKTVFQLLDASGRVFASVDPSDSPTQMISLQGRAADTYYLRVSATSGAAQYELKPSIGAAGAMNLDFTGKSSGSLDLTGLRPNTPYLLQVQSNKIPTLYSLQFDLRDSAPPAAIDLGQRPNGLRRDVILGGPGNDILSGGPGEDWIFGGAGDDLLTGGTDRGAEDLIFGGPGKDVFQIIPDQLPLLSGSDQTFVPTFNDRFDGGDGEDEMLFWGGDVAGGKTVPDEVAVRFNALLGRYEFTSLVWDVANQKFIQRGDGQFEQRFAFFQTTSIERFIVETRKGDDEVHADPGFKFPNNDSEWGIKPGDLQQGATLVNLEIRGGDGNDRLFGGAGNDHILGGEGDDLIAGGPGDDLLEGGAGRDEIYGNAKATPTQLSGTTAIGQPFVFPLAIDRLTDAPLARIPGVDLWQDSGRPDALTDSFRLEGAETVAGLASAESIGDFNGDGANDLLLQASTTSYILFGPVDLSQTRPVIDWADVILDTAALGKVMAHPGDVNGDGFADLAFVRPDTDQVNLVLGSAAPEHFIQKASSSLTFAGIDIPSDAEIHLLNWDGDGKSDLLLDWPNPISFGFAGQPVYGFVFSGAQAAGSGSTKGQLTPLFTLVKDSTDPPIALAAYLGAAASGLQAAAPATHQFQALVAGDIDGDGRDDLLLWDKRFATLSATPPTTSALPDLGRAYVITATGAGLGRNLTNPDAVWTTVALEGGFALGDLNGDGRADFALSRSLEDFGTDAHGVFQGAASVLVFYGATEPSLLPGVQFRRLSSTANSSDVFIHGKLRVTAGDFNGDRQMDLVVAETERFINNTASADPGNTPLDARGRLSLFTSVANRGPSLILDSDNLRADLNGDGQPETSITPDVRLAGQNDGDHFGLLASSPRLDLNRDRFDDLVIGAPGASGTPGKIYFIYGKAPRISLPIDPALLANSPLGDSLVDRGTGQPFLMDGTLAPNETGRWYEFTTLGDGTAGNELRVSPERVLPNSIVLPGTVGLFPTTSSGASDLGIMESDLAGLLGKDPTDLLRSSLFWDFQLRFGVAAPDQLTPLHLAGLGKDVVFYTADDGIHGEELWMTDGTLAGTILTKDIVTGRAGSNPAELTDVNGTLYFIANGHELWKSNGTAEGTILVSTIPVIAGEPGPANLVNVNGALFFTTSATITQIVNFKRVTVEVGVELWKSNGTAQGTGLVSDINPGAASSSPANLTNVNGTLYFSADDGTNGRELWRSNGTSTGTQMVLDINPLAGSSSPGQLTSINGSCYFSADDGSNGRELWRSTVIQVNGQLRDLTQIVKDIFPGSSLNLQRTPNSSAPSNFTLVGNQIFFAATDDNGRELWKTDGTSAGTVMVKDIFSGSRFSIPNSSSPDHFVTMNGFLYFTAAGLTQNGTVATGVELWRSNGTSAGTQLMRDLVAGSGSSRPDSLTVFNGRIYFTADDGVHGRELWVSDGNLGSANLVADLNPGSASSNPSQLAGAGNFLFFSASNGQTGPALWTSAGQANDPALVRYLPSEINGTFTLQLLQDAGDGRITASDATAPADPLAQIPFTLTGTAAGSLQLNLTDLVVARLTAARQKGGLADQVAAARLKFRFVVQTSSPNSPFSFEIIPGLNHSGIETQWTGHPGLMADLYDAQGRLMSGGKSILDLRPLIAGTYFLHIHRSPTGPSGTVPFHFEVDLIRAGETHPLSDRDEIHGGDGNDRIIGDQGLDRIFGEGREGNTGNTFIALPFEIRDQATGDVRDDQKVSADAADQPGALDPLVGVTNPGLQARLAEALGLPRTISWTDLPLASEPVHVTDLSELTELQASGSSILDLTGLDELRHLKVLDLAQNLVSDLAPLERLTNLQTLLLNDNSIHDISPLANLRNLRLLTLTNNFLGNDAFEVIKKLQDQGTTVLFDLNQPPALDPVPPQGTKNGTPVTLLITATDPDAADTLELSAQSDDPNVLVSWMGDAQKISSPDPQENKWTRTLVLTPPSADSAFAKTVKISLTVIDAHGRSDRQTFDLNVQTTGIYGRLIDKFGRAIVAWALNLVDGNGNTVQTALTDANGIYAFTNLDPTKSYKVVESLKPGWKQTTPANGAGYDVSFTDSGEVVNGMNFEVQQVLEAGPDQTVPEGDLVKLQARIPDALAGTLTFKWSVRSPAGNVIATGQSQTFQFTPSDNGDFLAQVTATDSNGQSFQDQATIHVLNVAPIVNGGPDRTVAEGTAVTFSKPFSDPGSSDTQTILWLVSSTNGQEISSGTGETFSFTPADDGTYTVSVTVTDDDGGIGSDSMLVTSTNAPPVADAGIDQNGFEGQPVPLRGTFTDPGAADTHVVGWEIQDSRGAIVAKADRQDFQFVPRDNGMFVAKFIVTDDDGAASSDNTILTIANVPPQNVSLGANQTVAEGTPVKLKATFADPGVDDTQTLRWSVVDAAGNAIAQATGATFSFAPPDNGAFKVSVVVTDKDGGIGAAQITLTATNVPPQANAGPNLIVDEGKPVVLKGQFIEPGAADNPSFQWTVTDRTGQQVASGNTLNFQFTPTGNGLFTGTLKVVDKDGGIGTDQMTVLVQNLAPTVNAGPDLDASEGTTVKLAASVSDPGPRDAIQVSWRILSPQGLDVANGTGPIFSFVPANDGTYQAIITATDQDGATGIDTALIRVRNIAPTVIVNPTTAPVAGQPATWTGSFSDPGADQWTGRINFGDGTESLLLLNRDKTFSFSHQYNQAGTYTLVVTVSDGEAGQAAQVISVQAAPRTPVALPMAINFGQTQRSRVAELAVRFTDDVSASLTLDDVRLTNLTTGALIDRSAMALVYDPLTNIARLSFPNLSGAKLNDGNYQLTVAAAGVTNRAGAKLASDFQFDFHVLAGDANGDRMVNELDLFEVWQSLGSGAANADLTGDGHVDSTDLAVVKDHFRNKIAPPQPLGGDFNFDGLINERDLYLLWRNLQKPSDQRDLTYDVNHDGRVTSDDLAAVKSNFSGH